MHILLDTWNIALTHGTGIATYGRNLSRINKEAGHEISLLHDFSGGDRSDPLLDEVAYFSALDGIGAPRLDRYALLARTALSLVGTPSRARDIRMSGFVQGGGRDRAAAAFNRILNAPMVYRLAHRHFAVTGRFLRVAMESPPQIAHWTSPLPLYVAGVRNVYTVHDIVPLKLPSSTNDHRKRYRKLIEGVVREADQIVTISDCTTRDLVELCPPSFSKISNTSQAIPRPMQLSSVSAEDSARVVENILGLKPQHYFLFVSAIEPKKNLGRLMKAHQASGSSLPLVVVGRKAWNFERELDPLALETARASLLGGADGPARIVLLDHVDSDTLLALVRSARALLFPSLYEGFGLPILEAMMCGTPVMTSNYGAMAETAAGGAALIDPYDVSDMAASIQRLEVDDDLCRSLQAAGLMRAEQFSWSAYRDRLDRAYHKALAA